MQLAEPGGLIAQKLQESAYSPVVWQKCLPEDEGRNKEQYTGSTGKSSWAGGSPWKLKLYLGLPLF